LVERCEQQDKKQRRKDQPEALLPLASDRPA
jgi:hypothetical protein